MPPRLGSMALLLLRYVGLALLLCARGDEGSAGSHSLLQYVRLISDVQGFFGSSSVFVVNAGQYENPLELLLMSKVSKELSRKFVLSQNINFTKFHHEIAYYNGKTVQPLFVVMLKSQQDLYQFSAITRHYNMALHKWLLIFDRTQDERFGDYCRNPRSNLLNLVVSTKMLVKCPDNWTLREWYSIDQLRVEAYNYGTWSPGRGVVRETTKHFHERRSDFKGLRLRVSMIKNAAPLMKEDFYTGEFFGTVLVELSKKMNFSIDLVSVEDSYGIFNETTSRWTGVIGKLVARQVDVGIGEFTMNRQRAAVVDYTVPLMLTFSDIYIKRPNMSVVDWSAYTKAFHKDIWFIIVVTLITAPMFLTLGYVASKGTSVPFHSLGEEYLHVWGIYCQKSLPDFPAATSLRIAYISIFTSSLVLYAVYSAYLTSYLTVFTPVVPFSSYDDFIAAGTYKLIVLRNSANHELFSRGKKSIFSAMGKFLKSDDDLPHDIYSAINQVCNENVVLFTNQLFIETISRYSPCEVMSLTQGRLDNLGLALTKHSPYTEIINYNLKSMRAYGIIERLKRRYFKKFQYVDTSYLPVSFFGIVPIVGIFGLGAVLSVGVLLGEYGFYWRRQAKVRGCLARKEQFSAVFKCGLVSRFKKLDGDSVLL